MSLNKRNLILSGMLAVIVIAAATFPLWRPLIVDDVVDEAFPGMTAATRAQFDALPQNQQDALIATIKDNQAMAVETINALLSPDTIVPDADQAMPVMDGNPKVLSTGSFVRVDAIHGAEGSATLYQLPDDSRILRFEDFRATNGPDLHVILTRSASPRSAADVGEDYIDLGQLKGNVGNQNYAIPADVDLAQYQSVVIFCVPFQVVFSTADQTASES